MSKLSDAPGKEPREPWHPRMVDCPVCGRRALVTRFLTIDGHTADGAATGSACKGTGRDYVGRA